jgi:DNA-binding NarL/FixJ family response regulator
MTDDTRDRYGALGDFTHEAADSSCGPLNGSSSDTELTQIITKQAWYWAASSEGLKPHTFELSGLWHGLRAGAWRFRETFSSAERHFAVVERVSLGKRSRVHNRNLEILTRVLLGQLPKAVAQDMKVAVSTVATGMQECLRGMGLPQRASTPPVLLMMAARATERTELAPTLARLTRIKAKNERYWLVSVERPDLEFPVPLSEAEACVVRELVSGRTHAEISANRATSPRTVANQLASAFQKFGVSGRGAIVQRLITHCFERHAAACGGEQSPAPDCLPSGA